MSILWIILIVILVLVLLGFFSRGRLPRHLGPPKA
jgi:hypothetical protein